MFKWGSFSAWLATPRWVSWFFWLAGIRWVSRGYWLAVLLWGSLIFGYTVLFAPPIYPLLMAILIYIYKIYCCGGNVKWY